MQTCSKVRRPVRGDIELFLGNIVLLRKQNTVLNSGMDLMAMALGGERYINGMYFAYDNSLTPYTDTTPPSERTASFYHSVGTGTLNIVRVPTLSRPEYSSTDPIYNENKASFVAVTAGAGLLPGAGNVLTDGLSQFYGAALAWLHPTDYQQDVLFSCVGFDDLGTSHFVKVAGAQLGLRWGVTLNN
jgi:hypothetical protein